jgi:raffinose/stachyose/melibiose transport system permease protein
MGARVRGDVLVSYSVLVVGSLVALYPFVSILLLALSAPDTRVSGFAVPDGLYLDNFVEAWQRGGFDAALWSSFVVTAVVVACAVVFSVLAGYALSILRTPLAGLFSGLLLIGIVVPYEATVIPLYHLMRGYGLLGELPAVILPQIGFSVALGTVWMRSYLATTPPALREAATIDGASRFQVLRLVLVPVAAPAIGTLAALLLLYTWNEFLLGLVLLADDPDAQTAPVALSYFAGNRRNSDPGVTAAAAVLVALPVLVAYVAAQRKFAAGLLAGGIKE